MDIRRPDERDRITAATRMTAIGTHVGTKTTPPHPARHFLSDQPLLPTRVQGPQIVDDHLVLSQVCATETVKKGSNLPILHTWLPTP